MIWYGSSPLARGLLGEAGRAAELKRIIPARAGFTDRLEEIMAERSDHPRSRGVYFGAMVGSFRGVGSSPLARGLPMMVMDEQSM